MSLEPQPSLTAQSTTNLLRRRMLSWILLGITGTAAAAAYWPTPRRRALRRIRTRGGDYLEQPGDQDGRPHVIHTVSLMNREVSKQDLVALRDLRPLHRVLLDGTPVTDDWLPALAPLEELDWLTLTDTHVTDAGLPHLQSLKGLKSLSLRRTRVTDAGLAHVRKLTGLTFLNLADTQVTDSAVAELKREFPNLWVYLPAADDE